MRTATGRTFKSGNSEAVRLPKDLGFGVGVELVLERSGEVLTLRRKRPSIAQMLDELERLPKPSSIEVRDSDIMPDREGL